MNNCKLWLAFTQLSYWGIIILGFIVACIMVGHVLEYMDILFVKGNIPIVFNHFVAGLFTAIVSAVVVGSAREYNNYLNHQCKE